MAIGVIGGLILSTVLSLVVVPSFYVIADKLAPKRRRSRPKRKPCRSRSPLR